MKATVCVTPIRQHLGESIRACFDPFGGIESIVRGEVFIKINAGMPDLSSMTGIDLILETVKLVQRIRPRPEKVYVFDSAAVGFPTRVVFKMGDLDKRLKRLGAIPLYLDEQSSVDMDFQGKALDYPVPIPKILFERLIKDKSRNTYINIPRLKTHLQTGVTACIKNQHGLIYDVEKVHNHHMMHEKVVELYTRFQPDFNLVDASFATNHGNFAYEESWKVPYNLLVGGTDAVAVDAVCARLVGMKPADVGYIRIAGERGLGVSREEEIDVVPDPQVVVTACRQLNSSLEQVPVTPAAGVRFIQGKERCCEAGCRYLSFYIGYLTAGKKCKPLVAIAGKGHDTSELDRFPGPFLVNGPCPVHELKDYFDQRKKREKKLKVIYVDEHFDLTKSMMGVVKGAGLSMMGMADMLEIPLGKLISGYVGAMVRRARFQPLM